MAKEVSTFPPKKGKDVLCRRKLCHVNVPNPPPAPRGVILPGKSCLVLHTGMPVLLRPSGLQGNQGEWVSATLLSGLESHATTEKQAVVFGCCFYVVLVWPLLTLMSWSPHLRRFRPAEHERPAHGASCLPSNQFFANWNQHDGFLAKQQSVIFKLLNLAIFGL